MKLIIDTIPSGKFHYDSGTQTFTAEMSDLRGYNPNKPMWDDAMDLGFSIINIETGNTMEFCLVGDIPIDLEIEVWKYESIKKINGVRLYVCIFND